MTINIQPSFQGIFMTRIVLPYTAGYEHDEYARHQPITSLIFK